MEDIFRTTTRPQLRGAGVAKLSCAVLLRRRRSKFGLRRLEHLSQGLLCAQDTPGCYCWSCSGHEVLRATRGTTATFATTIDVSSAMIICLPRNHRHRAALRHGLQTRPVGAPRPGRLRRWRGLND